MQVTLVLNLPIPTLDYVVIENSAGNPVTGKTFYTGRSTNFYAVAYNNSYGPLRKVDATWSSNDTKVASVTKGPTTITTLIPKYPGHCKIGASYGSLITGIANLKIIGLVHNINKDKYYSKVQACLDDAKPGDSIHILSWNFEERIFINNSANIFGNGAGKSVIKNTNYGHIVNINANWVTISDLKITGGYESGIYINSNQNNITLSNLTVSKNNYNGIQAYQVTGLTVKNCQISNNNYRGIYLSSPSRAMIYGNTVTSGWDELVYMYNAKNCTIRSNNLTNGYNGLIDRYGIDNIITNNNINNNYYGMRFYQTNDIVTHNNLNNNRYGGLYFEYCTDSLIANMTVKGSSTSVQVEEYSDVTIFNSSLGTGSFGIYRNSHLTLVNCTFKTNSSGGGNGSSNSGIYFNDEDSTFTVCWFMSVRVLTTGNNPISDARVIVKDLFDKELYNGTSDSNGICAWILIKYYIQNETTKTHYTPHNITCIAKMGTGNATPEPYMYTSGTITVKIKDQIAPIANAGTDIIVNQHQRVWFNGSGCSDNVGIMNWTWSFETNSKVIELYGFNVSFVFHDAGSYNVTLNVSDGINEASDHLFVTVLDITAPIADAGEDIYISQHEIAKFDGSKCSDNVGLLNLSWKFDYDGKETILYDSVPKFKFENAGTYNISLTVADVSNNLATDFLNVYVNDITSPVADAGPNQTIDQHETVQFNGSGCTDNLNVTNWTWNFIYDNNVVKLFSSTPKFTFDQAGEYLVSLKIMDNNQNWAADDLTVTVNDITAPSADAGTNITINQHQTAIFDGRKSTDDVAVVNWSWSFEYSNKQFELFGSSLGFAFDDAGVNNVTLRVSDRANNWGEDVIVVFVNDITPPYVSAGKNLTIDQNNTVNFDGSNSWDNTGIVNWTWTIQLNGAKTKLYGPKPAFNFTKAGNYTVTLKVKDSANNEAFDTIWINVTSIGGIDDGGDDTKPGDDDSTGKGKTTDYTGLFVTSLIITVLIIIILVLLFLLFRKKKEKPVDTDENIAVLGTESTAENETPGEIKLPEQIQTSDSSTRIPSIASPTPTPIPTTSTPLPTAKVSEGANTNTSPSVSTTPTDPTISSIPQSSDQTEPKDQTQVQTSSEVQSQPIQKPPETSQIPAPQPIPQLPQATITVSQPIPTPPLFVPFCPKCGGFLGKFPDGSFLCAKCGFTGK